MNQFIAELNSFNPALKYTHHYSSSSIDFLDLTIYKGPLFPSTNSLDIKTFQKPHNLYQYLHFTSCHQKSVYKSIISGELIRYVSTNTSEVNYEVMKHLFKKRLLARGYPKKFVEKVSATVSYQDRTEFLTHSQTPHPQYYPPLYKCPPPSQFKLLKHIILDNYHTLSKVYSTKVCHTKE